ncbi:hypothetical protein FZW96_11955 [Bacillus sp. BGMRC 2118]|nr:hypothetical protein FZW96_11955 [Bacillus sp. BGMRC 2118]
MKSQNALHQELKRKVILEKLLEKGITKSREGQDIHECDYAELKREWVMFSVLDIDVENKESGWF